jgi:transcriptional regulator with XRE-family HTH domain
MAQRMNFGSFAKQKRLELGVSLRQLCKDNHLDWANVSRIERGVSSPPKSREVLRQYAEALKIEEGSEDWASFMELAAISAGRIPDYVMNDEELVAKLPLVFRTVKGEPLTPEKLRQLAEDLRNV